MTEEQYLIGTVRDSQSGQRLDQVLVELFPRYSRSRLKSCILDGKVKIDGQVTMLPRQKMCGKESIEIFLVFKAIQSWIAQNIVLNIVYEDDDIIIINKPRDFVVHPGAGHAEGTLLNALLYYYPSIIDVPRAGIIHRLDKDTTGLMLVAKTFPAQTRLVELLKARKIIREYQAIVFGTMTAGGTVEQPIARHFSKRIHMAVHPMGKPAITHYRIMEKFRAHTRLQLRLETGRTHQVRVHMAHIKHPLIGDKLYGGGLRLLKQSTKILHAVLQSFDRQALHASMLRLSHPISAIEMEWHAPIPLDMVELLHALKADDEQFNN